jgi:serine/threonine-protein kinase
MELERLGKYEIVGKIGQGGMGEVYRASDPVLNRQVAIKTMTAGGVMEEELRKRFLREAQSAALLNHPNIVTVYDFGEEQGRMFIVMELLEGTDLKDFIRRPRLSLRAQVGLMEQICDGLAFAHGKGVIHRDLKPANLHVSRDLHVKIMDFGLARLATSDITRTGLIMGTPHYMSPEQVKGEPVTTRSDVFALGAVFHELLCGRKAFDAESMHSVMYQVMHTEPPPVEQLRPELPRALGEVVRAALDKDPARRPADAAALGRALRAAAFALSAAETQVVAPRAPLPSAGGGLPRTGLAAAGQTALQATPAEPTRLEPTLRSEEPTAVASPTLAATRVEAPAAAPRLRPAPRAGAGGAPSAHSRRRAAAMAGGALLLVAAGVVALVSWPAPGSLAPAAPSPAPPVAPSAVAGAQPAPAPLPGVESARRANHDRDYRRAVELARAALAVEPANVAAREALGAAQDGLAQGAAAAERVRAALRARDAGGATRALSRLATVDPGHPDLPALSRGLEDLARTTVAIAPPTPVPSGPAPRVAEPPPPPAPTPAPASANVPPPPQVPPVLAPAPAAPRPDEAVRQTLSEYQQACARVDILAIRRVFPLIRDGSVKAIEKMSRYDVRFDGISVRFEGERAAVVTADASYEATPRDGRRTPTRTQKRETIRLEKGADGAWVIRSID